MRETKSNLLIAVVTVVAFILLWDVFVTSRYGPSRPPAPVPDTKTATPGDATDARVAAPARRDGAEPIAAPAKETRTVLETEAARLVVESRGARVTSWQVREKDHWVELVTDKTFPASAPLGTFPDLNFAAEKRTGSSAVFRADHPDGFRVEKTIDLEAQPPFHAVSLRLTNQTGDRLAVRAALGWAGGLAKAPTDEEMSEKDREAVKAEMRAVGFDGRVKSWKPGFVFGRTIEQTVAAPFEWIGVDNDHFLAALIATPDPIRTVHVAGDRDTPAAISVPVEAELAPGESTAVRYQLFVGAKEYGVLKDLGHNLASAVDFGFFGVIAKGLLAVLHFLRSFTGNYGWAIVLLTIGMQILVFPLTRHSLKHSLKMKQLQPQLKKIQEQYKSDPKRLQIEMFNLYRKHGMRFMGMEGCIPMLIQIPIFIAFYTTLRVAYELRGAPWILWINDLAVYDPYYVLPILMGAGMFLQQKLTTVAADPAQARIMMLMPLIFTFMFFKLPAGLVLYWVVNSVSTIAIQGFLKFRQDRTEPRPA